MENYIIRVYRRDKKNPGAMIGLVHDVDTDSIHSFKHIDELIEMLTKAESFCRQDKKKTKGRNVGKKSKKTKEVGS